MGCGAGHERQEDQPPKLVGRLADSPGFRARVETARRLGISLKRFDGWTPVRETVYEYDEQGRLVRSVETEDTEWDDHQRGLMLALAEWEASRCPVCGGDPAECQDPDADRNNPRGKWVWWPKPPRECHVGTARRLWEQKPDDKRALIPQVVKQRRGEPAPQWR